MRTSLLSFIGLLMLATTVHADDDHEEHFKSKHGHHQYNTAAPVNATWKTECGSCHMAYPPGMLPGKSWNALMDNLPRHFGSNASLDKKSEQEIRQFLVYASADRDTRPLRPAEAAKTNIRINRTGWFLHKHDEVSPAVFRRKSIGSAANCMACHSGADKGNYDEHAVRIPR